MNKGNARSIDLTTIYQYVANLQIYCDMGWKLLCVLNTDCSLSSEDTNWATYDVNTTQLYSKDTEQ